MRMYCEKQRASEPVSIGSSATSQEGALHRSRPASSIPGWIAAGLMSGEPTICSRLSSSLTVLRASTLMKSAPMPNAISTTPASIPPYSKILRLVI